MLDDDTNTTAVIIRLKNLKNTTNGSIKSNGP